MILSQVHWHEHAQSASPAATAFGGRTASEAESRNGSAFAMSLRNMNQRFGGSDFAMRTHTQRSVDRFADPRNGGGEDRTLRDGAARSELDARRANDTDTSRSSVRSAERGADRSRHRDSESSRIPNETGRERTIRDSQRQQVASERSAERQRTSDKDTGHGSDEHAEAARDSANESSGGHGQAAAFDDAAKSGDGDADLLASMQGVIERMQQVLAGGRGSSGSGGLIGSGGAPGEAAVADVEGASGSNGRGQTQGGTQQGGGFQAGFGLTQLLGLGSANQAGVSAPAFSLAALGALDNGTTPAQALVEGSQHALGGQSGDSGSGGARAGGVAQAQGSGGHWSQAPGQLSDLNATRLARGLQNAVQQGGGAVTLRLTPPEMGTVRIELELHGARVNAQFHAQTDSARQMLTQQLSQLRQALESQGLTVERLGAQTMLSSTSQANSQQTQQQGQQGSASYSEAEASPNEGRSRGEYGKQGGDPQGDEQRSLPGEDESAQTMFARVLNELG